MRAHTRGWGRRPPLRTAPPPRARRPAAAACPARDLTPAAPSPPPPPPPLRRPPQATSTTGTSRRRCVAGWRGVARRAPRGRKGQKKRHTRALEANRAPLAETPSRCGRESWAPPGAHFTPPAAAVRAKRCQRAGAQGAARAAAAREPPAGDGRLIAQFAPGSACPLRRTRARWRISPGTACPKTPRRRPR